MKPVRSSSALLTLLLLVAAPAPAAENEGFARLLLNKDDKEARCWFAEHGAPVINPSAPGGALELALTNGGGWVRAATLLEDCVLEFDWTPEANSKAALFFREPLLPGKAPGADGRIVNLSEALIKDTVQIGKPNRVKLSVIGPGATLAINGKEAWKAERVTPSEGFTGFFVPADGAQAKFSNISITELGFKSLFNGRDLQGWHISSASHHSDKSKNKSGGRWVIEEGAIVGNQDIVGNGGLVVTDEKFGDCEVALEMKNDFGPDSGLFLRSDDQGRSYQYMIDYHDGGCLGGVYGEGIGGQPSETNFRFQGSPEKIAPEKAAMALQISPDQWPKFWKHGQWNELRARITGNPPRFESWINGVKFTDFTDDKKRLPDKGSIALQVHGGNDYTKQFVRYRNIRVRPIAPSGK